MFDEGSCYYDNFSYRKNNIGKSTKWTLVRLLIYQYSDIKISFNPFTTTIEFAIKFYTGKSGWSTVYTEGSQALISKNIVCFVLLNSILSLRGISSGSLITVSQNAL